MADIDKITVPSTGTTYNIKDTTARNSIPTKTSQLQNDSGFLTSAPVESVNGKTGAVTLTASDVSAVPTTRKVNNKALSTDITLTASDVSAIPTSDKQSYNSASSLSWNSLSADQKAMVPTIQGIAFWNGAYDGSQSNLKYSANGEICGKSGFTMTGQILTSFKTSVAVGSYGTAQTTIPNLVDEVRFSSGCMGSVSLGTAYTKDGVTIATGWYNFSYVPHRSGGVNGSASGDNCNYGTLTLWGMTVNTGIYVIRIASAAINSLHKYDYVVTGTSGDWKYKKWGDGTVEAWGTVSAGTYTGGQWVTNLYYQNITVTVPSGIFSTAPTFMQVSPYGNLQWTYYGGTIDSTTSLNLRFCHPNNTSQALTAHIYLRS